MKFKIVKSDNFGREHVSEEFVNVPDFLFKDTADTVAKILNQQLDDRDERYYRAVPADYKLYIFQP